MRSQWEHMRHPRRSIFLLSLGFTVTTVAALVACSSSSGGSQDEDDIIPEGMGRISGVVTDQTGAPLDEVSVNLDGQTAMTDASGRFRFDVEPGEYVVRFNREAYAPGALPVSVGEGNERLLSEGLL